MKYKLSIFLFIFYLNPLEGNCQGGGVFKAIGEATGLITKTAPPPPKHYPPLKHYPDNNLRKIDPYNNQFPYGWQKNTLPDIQKDAEYERISRLREEIIYGSVTDKFPKINIPWDANLFLVYLKGEYDYDKFQGFSLLVSIPQYTSEYKNIFKVYDNSNFEQLGDISMYITTSRNKDVKIVKSKEQFIDDLSEKIQRKPVILIGHNDNGDFYFPDGSFLTFDEIDKSIDGSKFPIVYLSCNSAYFTRNNGINFKLTYRDALHLSLDLDKALINAKKYSGTEFKDMFEQTTKEFLNKYKIIQTSKIVDKTILIGGTAYTIYELKFDEN